MSGSKIKIKNKYQWLAIIFKIHYMLISKYIFIFLSLFVIKSFRGMGVGGKGKAPQDFEI